jgi:hypothetical protein
VHFQEDTQSEILRCAQDDTRGEFFRSLLGIGGWGILDFGLTLPAAFEEPQRQRAGPTLRLLHVNSRYSTATGLEGVS